MRAVGKWLAKVLASTAALLLAIVLLPYASQMAARLLPDLSGRAVTASQILSQRFEESARLETVRVDEEGVLTSSTSALFLGTVQQVTITYRYQASLGIDLSRVMVSASGHTLTLSLPPMEVLSDSLTPQTIDRKDFWYPLTDRQREKLLEDERIACRARYLEEYATSGDAWDMTCKALDTTIAEWLGNYSDLSIVYERAAAEP